MLSYSLRARKNKPSKPETPAVVSVEGVVVSPPPAPSSWIVGTLPKGKKQQRLTKGSSSQQRQAIALLYHQVYYGTGLPINGRGGVISKICETLNVHNWIVSRVVKEAKVAFDSGDQYDATPKLFFRNSQKKVQPGTFIQHQVAYYRERFSIKTTASMINAMQKLELGERYNVQEHYIGQRSIRTALQQMTHRKCKVRKVTQATNNNRHWVKARLNFTAQLLVRFGRDLPSNFDNTVLSDPSTVDINLLQADKLMLSLYQIAWWDEIHIKQKLGEILDIVYRFAKNEKGLYDDEGNVPEDEKLVSFFLKNVKFLFIEIFTCSSPLFLRVRRQWSPSFKRMGDQVMGWLLY